MMPTDWSQTIAGVPLYRVQDGELPAGEAFELGVIPITEDGSVAGHIRVIFGYGYPDPQEQDKCGHLLMRVTGGERDGQTYGLRLGDMAQRILYAGGGS